MSSKDHRHHLSGPGRMWESNKEFQIRFLKEVGLEPYHSILDIGCGTLLGGVPVIEYLQEGKYVGIDVREIAISAANESIQEAELEHKNPTLLVSQDLSTFILGRKFDFILAYSVTFHLTDIIVGDLFKFVNRHLSNAGVFYTNVNIIPYKTTKWQGFPSIQRPLWFYKEQGSKHGLHVVDVGSMGELGRVADRDRLNQQRMLKLTKADAVKFVTIHDGARKYAEMAETNKRSASSLGYSVEIKQGSSVITDKPLLFSKEVTAQWTIWMDADSILVGTIDELFTDDYDLALSVKDLKARSKRFGAYLYAGLIVARNTSATKRFFNEWIACQKETGKDDQFALNAVLADYLDDTVYDKIGEVIDCGGVRIRLLDPDVYVHQQAIHDMEPPGSDVKILHFKGRLHRKWDEYKGFL